MLLAGKTVPEVAGAGICWLAGMGLMTFGTSISTGWTGASEVDKAGLGWVCLLGPRPNLEASELDAAYGDDEYLFDFLAFNILRRNSTLRP